MLPSMTSTCPVTFTLDIRPSSAYGTDRIAVTAWGGNAGTHGSLWRREVPIPTTAKDTPADRLRAGCLALIALTGGFPGE